MRETIVLLVVILLLGAGCGNRSGNKEPQANQDQEKSDSLNEKPDGLSRFLPSLVTITTYDGDRRMESGFGFFADSQCVVSLNSFFGNCDRATIQTWDGQQDEIDGFLAVDRINDLILLKVKNINQPPLKLYTGDVPRGSITRMVSLPRGPIVPVNKGKMLQELIVTGTKMFSITNMVYGTTQGRPVFLNNDEVLGVGVFRTVQASQEYLAIPALYVLTLLEGKDKKVQSLSLLSGSVDPAVSAQNARIKGVLIETNLGNISIRLFNDTPEYRDNFLKLVRENYYDSLLWHRVIGGFVIQSGAADTKYAKKGDIIGWKGPGYTLPAHIHPKYFHRRGLIGVPRLPDDHNVYKRSDGSQFYIVTGRLYGPTDLADIEKEKKFRFTPEEKEVYQTIGGAPTLDHEYSLFGEVIQGMDIADKINAVQVDNQWRPLKDVRIKRIRILK